MTTRTNPIERLEALEAHRTELGRERTRMEGRKADIERERTDCEDRAARSTDVDELRRLREQITEIDLEARVIENRTPGVLRQLGQLNVEITQAQMTMNRYRVAGLIVDAAPVLERALSAIDELAKLRQRAVEAGASETLLAPPPCEGVPRSHGDVVAFTLADHLAVHLRGAWAETVLPEARRDAGR